VEVEVNEMTAGSEKAANPARPVVCNPNLEPRLSDSEIERMAAILKAIAHPVRIKILDLILQCDGEVCSCDIERFFELSQPTISHHIKLLQETGLIASEPRGVWVYHKIRTDAFSYIRDHLDPFRHAA
jgi:ArsR family transcriptional regulator, arsenate/arsenite/antimonite-responsive transcriptional repressor